MSEEMKKINESPKEQDSEYCVTFKTKEEKQLALRNIDQRVSRLERINDSYIAKTGNVNQGIMDKINQLMDIREEIFLKNVE